HDAVSLLLDVRRALQRAGDPSLRRYPTYRAHLRGDVPQGISRKCADSRGHVAGPVARSLSATSTGAVGGRMPRQTRNDSAACSTSMPQPWIARAQPRLRAHRTKAVSDFPYAMS